MANASQKKRAKESESTGLYLLVALLASALFFLTYRLLFGDGFETWALVVFALQLGLSFFIRANILHSIRSGFSYEYYFDCFAVNLLAQAISAFSNYGLLLYLVVPAFAAYKAVRALLDWVFTPDPEDEDEVAANGASDRRARRQARREQRAAIGRRGYR